VEYASEILDEPAKWSVSEAVKPGFVTGRLLQNSKQPRIPLRMVAACGVIGVSHRVRQADRPRSSAARDTGNSSGSRRVAGRWERSRRACSRSIA